MGKLSMSLLCVLIVAGPCHLMLPSYNSQLHMGARTLSVHFPWTVSIAATTLHPLHTSSSQICTEHNLV